MDIPSDLIAVRPAHRFDEAALARFLAHHVAGYEGPLEVRQFEGGQSNPTYFLRTPGRGYVLRRKPPGKLLPSAHAVEREYRVISALADTPVPVPRTYALCEDAAVIGTAFFVMEHVPGRIFRAPTLPDLEPEARRGIFDSLAETMARLHAVDYAALGLEDFGRPGNYFERQIGRWSKMYRASETQHIPAMEDLIRWLPEHIPPGDETSLVHGDCRLGNCVVHPTEPRIVAVLDWELSTLGHPLADLAFNCLVFRLPPSTFLGFLGEDIAGQGYPTEAEHIAAYCRHAGRESIPSWDFYLAFAIFRMAAIAQGIMGRVRDGTAAGADAADRGARAPVLAQAAWELVRD